MTPLKVFIGYDPRQPVAFQVAAHSVLRNASVPVSVTALRLSTLPIKRRGLTEFTFSRFLVPWLSNFTGTSIFMDSDVLVRGDVQELQDIAFGVDKAVFVVPHNSRPFERPSVMVFNNPLCTKLSPEEVDNLKTPLFDFGWAKGVGKLAPEWNHLVGYDAPNPSAKLVHFTMGIPIWEETAKSEFAAEWWKEHSKVNSSVSFDELMGKSVHVPHLQAVS